MLINKLLIRDIVHFMCEYRVWTKSYIELVDKYLLPHPGVLYD